MSTVNRDVALELFSLKPKTLASARSIAGPDFRVLEGAQSEVAPLEIDLETLPVAHAQFDAPKTDTVWISNVESTIAAWPFSDSSGSVNYELSLDVTSQEADAKNIAGIVTIDGAASALESSRFEIADTFLEAAVTLLYGAVFDAVFTLGGKVNAPTSIPTLIANDSQAIDANGERVSVPLLNCVVEKLRPSIGHPLMYTMAMSKTAYAQFVELMMTSGNARKQYDEVTRRDQWFFDGVRVLPSYQYLKEAPGVVAPHVIAYRSPAALIPRAQAASVPPAQKGGMVVTTQNLGATVRQGQVSGAPDQLQLHLSTDAGVMWRSGYGASITNLSEN